MNKVRSDAVLWAAGIGLIAAWVIVARATAAPACTTVNTDQRGNTTQVCDGPPPELADCWNRADLDTATGDLSIVLCPDPTTAKLRNQLRVERARHKQAIRRLQAENRRLRAKVRVRWQPQVDHAIHLASKAFGVDHAGMRRVARCESTMNPTARNGRYLGLFQAGPAFWAATPFTAFDRTDPYANALATAMVVAREGWGQWTCKP